MAETERVAEDPALTDDARRARARKRRCKAAETAIGLAVAATLVGVPCVSAIVSQASATTYVTQLSSTSHGEADEAELADAEAYNAALAGEGTDGTTPSAYAKQLDLDAAMGSVEIPSVNLRLPIYHGTDEAALAAGVGHLETSSLPVGGTPSNCVLTAHSGMAGELAFDRIRELEDGDVVLLRTCGETLAYEVDGHVTISQDDADAWERETRLHTGRDEVTLVTCTPYGVNDHRLIVHAVRVPYEESMDEVPPTAYLDYRTLPMLAVVAGVAGVVAGAVHRRHSITVRSFVAGGTRHRLARPLRLRPVREGRLWHVRCEPLGVDARDGSVAELAWQVRHAMAEAWRGPASPRRSWVEERVKG